MRDICSDLLPLLLVEKQIETCEGWDGVRH